MFEHTVAIENAMSKYRNGKHADNERTWLKAQSAFGSPVSQEQDDTGPDLVLDLNISDTYQISHLAWGLEHYWSLLIESVKLSSAKASLCPLVGAFAATRASIHHAPCTADRTARCPAGGTKN